MDKKLLDILVCPVSGAALAPADSATLTRINAAIDAGEACHPDGSAIETPLQNGLVTADGNTVYRIDDGIPMMLPEHGIEVR